MLKELALFLCVINLNIKIIEIITNIAPRVLKTRKMQVKYSQTEDDLVKYSVYYQLEAPERRINRIMLFALPSLIFFLFVAIIGFLPQFDILALPIWMLIIIFLLGLSPALLMSLFLKKLVEERNRKFLQKDENKILLGHKNVFLSEQAIIMETATNRGQIDWKVVEKIVEITTHLLIILNNNSALIIPRIAFDTIETYLEFKKTAELYFAKNKAARTEETVKNNAK